MSHPTAEVNDRNCIFWKMPNGKIDKNGSPRDQGPQKGNTCIYYAVRRILKEQQIRSEHGKRCSAWRKERTVAPITPDSSDSDWYKAMEMANRNFFKACRKNPDKAAREFFESDSQRRFAFTGVSMTDLSAQLKTTWEKEIATKEIGVPRVLEHAALAEVTKGYGLEEINVSDMLTFDQLMRCLKRHGPIVTFGKFGHVFYNGVQPEEFPSLKIGETQVYGWKKGTPTSSATCSHAIVVIGAMKKGGKEYVYWVDPNHRSTVEHGQMALVHSWATFCSKRLTVQGFGWDELDPAFYSTSVCAFYNPSLFEE